MKSTQFVLFWIFQKRNLSFEMLFIFYLTQSMNIQIEMETELFHNTIHRAEVRFFSSLSQFVYFVYVSVATSEIKMKL